MKVTCKALFQATIALSSLCIASQAYAAEAPEDETAAGNAGDIIVSARRIEERLQDVPISVAVVNQEQLTKSNVTSADDLARIVPGLNVEQRYTSETNAFAIRGFNQALRTTSSVGTYFGEVVAPRGGAGAFPGGDGAGPGALFDLQNVQVLKGPQGTLFGRNTTGGAVLLTPKKPTDQLEGYVQGSYGNYNMFGIQGVLNLPLSESIRLRLGVDRQTRDGTQNNVSGIGPSKLNDVDYYALRGSLVIDLSPDLENYTIVSYVDSDHVGTQPQMYRANPNTTFGGALLGTAQVARQLANPDPYAVENNLATPRSVMKQFQVINTTTWTVSDTITIKNIASYATVKLGLNQSVFGTNFNGQAYVAAVLAPSFARPTSGGFILSLPTSIDTRVSTAQAFNADGQYGNDQRSFSEELQLQGRSGDGKLNYVVGLYYEHSTPGNETNNMSISAGALCLTQPYTGLASMRCLSNAGASVNVARYTIEYINMAAFGQATYALTDQFKLTGGIRITYDRTKATSINQSAAFIGPNWLPAPFSAVSIPLSAFVAPTIQAGAAGCQITHAAAPNCLVAGDRLKTSSTRPTWTLSAQYNPNPDLMLYGTYSRGYRQGSAAPAAIGGKESFDPETVDSFELGGKTSWRGTVPGYFNLTGFYSKIKDAQVLVGLSCTRTALEGGCPAGSSATSVFNAGKAHMYGIEFDGSLRPSDFFRVSFAGAWVHTNTDDFVADISPYVANFNTILNTTTIGDPLPLTPEFSGNIAATLKLPVPEDLGKIEFSAMYRYASTFQTNASDANIAAAGRIAAACGANCTAAQLTNINFIRNTPVDKATAVKQIDLNLDWSNVGRQPVDLSFFVTNLTNQVTYTLTQSQVSGFGFDVRYLGQPRMYGARLKVSF